MNLISDPITKPSVVLRGSPSGFIQEIVARHHLLKADDPSAEGGGDIGPTPYELLLAALGACTSMTVGMYALRKGWPLEGVVVRLTHSKIHAADCAECETGDGMLDRNDRELELTGPLTFEQRSRLLEIANRCPVHRTLTSEIDICSRLANKLRSPCSKQMTEAFRMDSAALLSPLERSKKRQKTLRRIS